MKRTVLKLLVAAFTVLGSFTAVAAEPSPANNLPYIVEEGTTYFDSCYNFGSGKRSRVVSEENDYVTIPCYAGINGYAFLDAQGRVLDYAYEDDADDIYIPEAPEGTVKVFKHFKTEISRNGWVDSDNVVARNTSAENVVTEEREPVVETKVENDMSPVIEVGSTTESNVGPNQANVYVEENQYESPVITVGQNHEEAVENETTANTTEGSYEETAETLSTSPVITVGENHEEAVENETTASTTEGSYEETTEALSTSPVITVGENHEEAVENETTANTTEGSSEEATETLSTSPVITVGQNHEEAVENETTANTTEGSYEETAETLSTSPVITAGQHYEVGETTQNEVVDTNKEVTISASPVITVGQSYNRGDTSTTDLSHLPGIDANQSVKVIVIEGQAPGQEEPVTVSEQVSEVSNIAASPVITVGQGHKEEEEKQVEVVTPENEVVEYPEEEVVQKSPVILAGQHYEVESRTPVVKQAEDTSELRQTPEVNGDNQNVGMVYSNNSEEAVEEASPVITVGQANKEETLNQSPGMKKFPNVSNNSEVTTSPVITVGQATRTEHTGPIPRATINS